jgi:hypothetical protein
MTHFRITQGMLDAYGEAWEATERWEAQCDNADLIKVGAKRRAGLQAVFEHPDFQQQLPGVNFMQFRGDQS